MSKNVTITISRQYGSNGREIGRRVAEYLDIGYYNKKIMERIAVDMGIDPDFFKEENQTDDGMYHVGGIAGLLGGFGFSGMTDLSVNTAVFEKASELIKGIASLESSVIVGRCGAFILKDDPNTVSVFIYSDPEDRLKRIISDYNVNEKKAKKILEEKDAKRSRFYEFNTNRKWGNPLNYDVMINSSRVSVEEASELLAGIYERKMGHSIFKGAFTDQHIAHKSLSDS